MGFEPGKQEWCTHHDWRAVCPRYGYLRILLCLFDF